MTDLQFPDILIWAIPFFIVCIGLELLWLKYHPVKDAYTFKDARTSLIMGIGSTISDLLLKVLLVGTLFWVWQFRFFDLGASIWVILAALVLMDIVYYWIHFTYHKSRWFWATHIVHHSSEHFNLTTALRQQWTNGISGTVLFKFPLVFLGFHPAILVFVMAINLIYQFWFHTETIDKMPRWFEAIMNTPSPITGCIMVVIRVIWIAITQGFSSFGIGCSGHLSPNCRTKKLIMVLLNR